MIKKQTFIRTISFLSAAILFFCGFAIKEKSRSQKYLLMIENQYSRAFNQLNSSLNNINTSVEKTLYVTSAKKMSSLAAEIFSEAELAKSALSELPGGEGNSSTIYRFLSQVGNYVLSISKNITSKELITKKQREELKILSDTAKTVSQVISDSDIEYNNPEQWAQAVENRLNSVVNAQGLADSLSQLEEDMSDYPTLIYDGPYSDHILQKQPLMTANAKEYSENEALQLAKKCVGKGNNLKFIGMQNGKIECYVFADDKTNISVSKLGGYVVYMRKNRTVNDSKLAYDEMLEIAQDYLQDIKINNMKATYYYTDNGVCVINFAYLDGKTICYTDLVKVGVATDTGEIMFLETTGYLTNHTTRAFHSIETTVEQAKQKVSSDLEVIGYSITLIPTDSGGEVRCYEFLCHGEENREILVYINVQSLEEEQIYILLKNDGGILVK